MKTEVWLGPPKNKDVKVVGQNKKDWTKTKDAPRLFLNDKKAARSSNHLEPTRGSPWIEA